MPVPLPAVFGKYQLLDHIAEGGMADVYLGRLTGPGGFEKRLVIKVIRPELAERREFCELFVAEAKITVSLTHANIVPVYELGMAEGQYYLAMELVDGPTVHRLVFDPVRGGPLPFALCAYIIEQVLRGLDYAHRNGVVHRDLSSANVLCSRDGEVKIVDFGIAAGLQSDSVRLNAGSVGYIAPEQQGGGEPDVRSDLYAVGVLLAEMATGRRFLSLREEGLVAALSGLPEGLLAIAERATRERPEDRYADAAAFLVEISRYLREVFPPTQSDLSKLVRKRAPDERRLLPQLRTILTQYKVGPHTRPLGRISSADPSTATVPQRSAAEMPPARPASRGSLARPTAENEPVPSAAGAQAGHEPEQPTTPASGAEVPANPPRRGDATPTMPHQAARALVHAAPEGPASIGVQGIASPGETITFASRPARVHATWRTYAGAALIVAALVAIGVLSRPLLGSRPRTPGDRASAASSGFLRIDLPPGASLSVDGLPAEPGTMLRVLPGSHRVEASAPGHRSVLLDVEVHAGETVRERLVLSWAVGTLELESVPAGAQVILQGEAAGATPVSLDVPLDRAVTLRLHAKGYAPAMREILPSEWVAISKEARLGVGSDPSGRQPKMRVTVRLEPLQRGMLTVGATPWAQVFVDGELKGDTPIRRLSLSAGPHVLRLSCPPPGCPERREHRLAIHIEPGKEIRRVVDFRLGSIVVRQ